MAHIRGTIAHSGDIREDGLCSARSTPATSNGRPVQKSAMICGQAPVSQFSDTGRRVNRVRQASACGTQGMCRPAVAATKECTMSQTYLHSGIDLVSTCDGSVKRGTVAHIRYPKCAAAMLERKVWEPACCNVLCAAGALLQASQAHA